MTQPLRVVFDCNVYIQALAKPDGPAGRCVAMALEGKFALFISQWLLDEIRDVTGRPEVASKLRLLPERTEILLANLPAAAVFLPQVPQIWNYDRDPSDAHYVNLAIAAGANMLVSRDRDLLDLMDVSRPEARELHNGFPEFRVLDPVVFLKDFERP